MNNEKFKNLLKDTYKIAEKNKNILGLLYTAVATYTVTNNSAVGINAKIAAASVTEETANSEYYTATAKFADGTDVLAKGETATLTVTVKLDKAPVDAITGKFTVSFTATPVTAAN